MQVGAWVTNIDFLKHFSIYNTSSKDYREYLKYTCKIIYTSPHPHICFKQIQDINFNRVICHIFVKYKYDEKYLVRF